MNRLKYLLFCLLSLNVIACGNSNQEPNSNDPDLIAECVPTSLSPQLYAEICLPEDATVEDSPEYNSSSNESYRYVKLDIDLPSGEKMYIRELKTEKVMDESLEKRREETESKFSAVEIHESTPDYFIQKTKNGGFVIHFFKSHYGWPYSLTSSELESTQDVKIILSYFNTFKFKPRD